MITFHHGDLLQSDAQALVNTVNCVGVMGAGIALAFKKAYPSMFEAYKLQCQSGLMKPGGVRFFKRDELGGSCRYLVNFATKNDWRMPSELSYVELGLKALREGVVSRAITSIAIPPLGCGLGGLGWNVVRPMIVSTFNDVPNLVVHVYEPHVVAAPRV